MYVRVFVLMLSSRSFYFSYNEQISDEPYKMMMRVGEGLENGLEAHLDLNVYV